MADNARKEAAETAKSRAKIYGFLAAIFRAEPSLTIINDLKKPDFATAFADIGLSLGKAFEKAPSSQLVEDLAVEYTRLFIGPGSRISPHESVFTESDGGRGDLWGEKTVEVKKFIETAGFTYEQDFTGLPDHVSAELEFMQKLAESESDLLTNDESERAHWCRSVQRKFLDEHILKWVPKLCDAVIERAELPFYLQMAEMTRSFVTFDRELIGGKQSETA